MKSLYTIFLLCAVTILAGCAPSEKQFLTFQEAVRGSAKIRQLFVEECISQARPKDIRALAIALDTSEKAALRLYCTRFVEAIRSGRITYADMMDIKQGRPSPKLVRIFQGR